MTQKERIHKAFVSSCIVPVVVLDDAKDAVKTAEALLKGGIGVMEITFRTDAAEESIKKVATECKDMIVGAGTVITLDMCKRAVNAGAKFIVSPGFDDEVVAWCVENDIPVTPGCVTPTEIMRAMKYGLNVVKFFPANVYGGVKALKSLSGPFGKMKFIPTGGINDDNSGEAARSPFIEAVGGSWVCPKDDIKNGNFDHITELSAKARKAYLGYELAHVGINALNPGDSMDVTKAFAKAFSLEIKEGNSSNFASTCVEIMKNPYLGKNGHIAISTNNVESAMADLEAKGFEFDMNTVKTKGDKITVVYLKGDIGGFAVHLVQK